MPYTYIARRRLLVGDTREPGELVPEAADWPNLKSYLEIGWVEKIATDDPEAVSALANGGIAPSDTLVKIGESGKEIVDPRVAQAARMREAKAAKAAQAVA